MIIEIGGNHYNIVGMSHISQKDNYIYMIDGTELKSIYFGNKGNAQKEFERIKNILKNEFLYSN